MSFSLPDFSELRRQIDNCTEADVRQALSSSNPGPRGLAALLSPAADALLPQLAAKSRDLTLLRFGRATQL